MGSWWLSLGFSAHLWNPHVPNKRNSSTDSDEPWIPKCPVKGSLHLLYRRVCRCIVQVTMVAKKSGEMGNAEEDFFGEFWSTIFGTTELWEHFLVRQVFIFFFHCRWDFPDGEAPFEVSEALTSGFRGKKKTRKSIEGWIGSIDSILYQVERPIFLCFQNNKY